jgi:hypothetical protein
MANYEPKGVDWMREIGRLGGLASGKRRYDKVPAVKRHLIAVKAARFRWGKGEWSEAEETAYLEGRKAGLEDTIGLPHRKRSRPPATLVPLDSGKEPPAESRPAYDHPFIERIAQDPEFLSALELEKQPKVRYLIRLLGSLKYSKSSIRRIAARAGLSLIDLADLFRNYSFVRALFEAMDRLPELVRDTVDNGFNRDVACPRCDGIGQIKAAPRFQKGGTQTEWRECPQCRGTAKVKVEGSDKARGRIWQMVGFERRAQAKVTVNTSQFSAASVIEELEALDRPKRFRHPTPAIEEMESVPVKK